MLKCSILINHLSNLPLNPHYNYHYMPTEREHSNYNDLGHDVSKYTDIPRSRIDLKTDSEPSYRLKFLQAIDMDHCPTCIHVSKVILYALAIYGFISLFF